MALSSLVVCSQGFHGPEECPHVFLSFSFRGPLALSWSFLINPDALICLILIQHLVVTVVGHSSIVEARSFPEMQAEWRCKAKESKPVRKTRSCHWSVAVLQEKRYRFYTWIYFNVIAMACKYISLSYFWKATIRERSNFNLSILIKIIYILLWRYTTSTSSKATICI